MVDFPGGPIVKSLGFHCRRHGFDAWMLRGTTKVNIPIVWGLASFQVVEHTHELGMWCTPTSQRKKLLCSVPFQSSAYIPLMYVCAQSCPTLCDPQTVLSKASLSMGFSQQEYWSGLPFRPPGNFPNLAIESVSLLSMALACRFFITEPPCTSYPAVYFYDILHYIVNW